jgi:uncharacterized protein (TIGR03437 family)
MKNSLVVLGLLIFAPVPAWAQQQYIISTIAGGGPPLVTPARGLDLQIGAVYNIATDVAGNVYFPTANSVVELDQNGIVTRIAGTSHQGYSGDGGPAVGAQLSQPSGVTVDSAGNLFIVDGVRVRRVAPTGTIATVAGNGTQGYSGDGGPAVSAQFGYPQAIAADGEGNLFIADLGNNSVRKVSSKGIITTVAGNGIGGFSGDGGPATKAQLSTPSGLAVDDAGNLYIADYGNLRVRKVSTSGIITTVAGNGEAGFEGDSGSATDANLLGPQGISLDSAGSLYIADCDCDWDGSGFARIRKISPNGIITTVAGNGTCCISPGDGGPATSAQLEGAGAVAVDAIGNVFIADSWNLRVRKVSPDGIIHTVAGVGTVGPPPPSGDGGPATSAPLSSQPWGVAVDDAAGDLFIMESTGIRKISPDGIIHTVANVGGNAIVEDAQGNLFTAGLGISRVSPGGAVTRVAGVGGFGTPGVGGYGIAIDNAGSLFVGSGGIVSRISSSGVVTTAAGGGKDVPGDGGPATSAQLNNVTGLQFDRAGNLFLSETYGNRVRRVSPDGTITTVAGNGIAGFSGDGGQATSAQLNGPDGLALDADGNLYIAETYNNRVRMVTPDGVITTIAGTGVAGFSGDDGPAVNADLYFPWSVAVDQQGNVYVADTFNYRVRVLRPTHSSILISSVVDAASQRAEPVSPGKIVVIRGAGLGPPRLVQNQASNGQFGTQLGGTKVSFNGIAAPLLYTSASQVAAVVPYEISGTAAQITVANQGQTSAAFAVPVAPTVPGIFTSNQSGAGQIAAVNAVDGTINSAVNPVKTGAYITLYATGEGQTSPAGLDGQLGAPTPPKPLLPVTVTVGGIPSFVQYAGGVPGQISGLMQIDVQIPRGVQPGGYVPVTLKVGEISTTPDAVWIAVSGN